MYWFPSPFYSFSFTMMQLLTAMLSHWLLHYWSDPRSLASFIQTSDEASQSSSETGIFTSLSTGRKSLERPYDRLKEIEHHRLQANTVQTTCYERYRKPPLSSRSESKALKPHQGNIKTQFELEKRAAIGLMQVPRAQSVKRRSLLSIIATGNRH